MKQIVLVTGGFGLVGHSLQKIVKDTIHHEFVFLSSKNGDLRDINVVDSLFDLHKPDVVVHLASCVGGVYANMSKNYDYLVDNLRINTNVVDACDRFGVKRLISCLSTCIFPDKNIIYPITSDQLHNGLPHDSNIGYAFSKRIMNLTGNLLSQKGKVEEIKKLYTDSADKKFFDENTVEKIEKRLAKFIKNAIPDEKKLKYKEAKSTKTEYSEYGRYTYTASTLTSQQEEAINKIHTNKNNSTKTKLNFIR